MNSYLSVLLILILSSLFEISGQSGSVKQVKLSSFELQSSVLIDNWEEISTSGYRSNVYWFPVEVPSTVLTGLVANGIYHDPYAAFPSVVWQVYDWFLQPNAGYYFMQNACELLHVQLNQSDYKVAVINRKYISAANLTVQVDLFGLDSRPIFSESANLSLSPSEVKETVSLAPVLEKMKEVTIVVLKLKDAAGKVISRNTYWLSSNGDFKDMNIMPETQVKGEVLERETGKNETKWTIQLTNNTGILVFFVRTQLMTEGEEILPYFSTGNYLTLAPEVCDQEFVGFLEDRGIVVAAGHSNATFREAVEGFKWGIQSTTHLFNAM